MPNGREKGDRNSKKVFRSSRKSTSQSGGGTAHLVLSSDYRASELNAKTAAINTLKTELLAAFKRVDSKVASITLGPFTDSATSGKVQIDVTVLPNSVNAGQFSMRSNSISTALNKVVKISICLATSKKSSLKLTLINSIPLANTGITYRFLRYLYIEYFYFISDF